MLRMVGSIHVTSVGVLQSDPSDSADAPRRMTERGVALDDGRDGEEGREPRILWHFSAAVPCFLSGSVAIPPFLNPDMDSLMQKGHRIRP